VLHVPSADAEPNAGDRNYLVLAKPNVIMNDIRLRGLAVAGTDAAGRKSPNNHAQTARNLRRSLRNAAAGARLIQADGLNNESAADVATSLSDAGGDDLLVAACRQTGLVRRQVCPAYAVTTAVAQVGWVTLLLAGTTVEVLGPWCLR
jgi:hypothetical protein